MNISTASQWSPSIEHAHAPTVFIVEPDPPIRAALARQIDQGGWHSVMTASAEEFLTRQQVPAAACLVVEEHLPGMTGLDLQRRVAHRKELSIIFTSNCPDVGTTVRAIKAGAFDFLMKPICEELLLRSVGLALKHSADQLGEATRIHNLRQCYQSLSRREREVLRLVAVGRLNKQVGFELGISEITVKAHRGSMMRKMQAGSIAELVGMVADLPWEPDDWHASPRSRTTFQNGKLARDVVSRTGLEA